jgi:signal transduction histidine kinase
LGKGEVLGMIAVANREGGYCNEDLEAMTVLSEAIVQVFMRSRAEKALRAAKTELELTNRRKGDFLSILSHEIRNPLTSITMGLSLLDCTEPDSPKARQAREIMKRQAKQLTRIVDDLLVMTRLNQQKLLLKKERLEINAQICRIVDEFRGMFQEKGINLRVELFAFPLYVDADEIRLTQIVGNLLHNAVKYNRKGGSALVKVSEDEAEEFVDIQVEDTGIGISQEILPHLFAPYMQADESLHHGNGGLGLGLMLVKGLTELHGGEVTAHSDGPGEGSVFTVRLPLAREISQINVPRSSKELIKRSMRVLLIEDLVDVSDVLKSLLEYEGHEVVAVHTGREGIAKARLFCPQVVLCDIGLPDIDGYQVAKAFLSDEELQDIFLISLSGYGWEKDLQRAKEAGFQLQLKKPVDLTALREALLLVPHD